jgi:hypothetical protein
VKDLGHEITRNSQDFLMLLSVNRMIKVLEVTMGQNREDIHNFGGKTYRKRRLVRPRRRRKDKVTKNCRNIGFEVTLTGSGSCTRRIFVIYFCGFCTTT